MGLGQEASSEPSEQSLSLSQTKVLDIHWPLPQRNSSGLHCLAAAVRQEVERRGVNVMMRLEVDLQ